MGPTQLSPGQAETKPWETGGFLSFASGGWVGWSAEKWWVLKAPGNPFSQKWPKPSG